MLGDEGVSVLIIFKFAENTNKENYAYIINKFPEYCAPRQNVVFEW